MREGVVGPCLHTLILFNLALGQELNSFCALCLSLQGVSTALWGPWQLPLAPFTALSGQDEALASGPVLSLKS